MDKTITPDDKRIIAKKTGYSLSMISQMIKNEKKMTPVVKKEIDTWLKNKQQFINK